MLVLALTLALFAYSSYAEEEENDKQMQEQEDAVEARPENDMEDGELFDEADLDEDDDVPIQESADAKAWWHGRRRRSWIRRRGVRSFYRGFGK